MGAIGSMFGNMGQGQGQGQGQGGNILSPGQFGMPGGMPGGQGYNMPFQYINPISQAQNMIPQGGWSFIGGNGINRPAMPQNPMVFQGGALQQQQQPGMPINLLDPRRGHYGGWT